MSDDAKKSRFSASDLLSFAEQILISQGLPVQDANAVAEALVSANLRGLDTHGLMRIPAYLKRLRAGLINNRPSIRIERRMPTIATVDADNGMGHVAARAAMEACIDAAGAMGLGVATVRHSNHFGAASVYTVPAATRGFIAIALSPASPSLAPHGSRSPMFGTNPFAIAAPAGRYDPWSLDIAASVASRGKIREAARQGDLIPEGWALDAMGVPTRDPTAAIVGTVLPFAGAKGSGLAMMVDILGGVLSGAGFAGAIRDWNTDYSGPADVGHFMMALKIDAFMPLSEFELRMETAIDRIKALPSAYGFDQVSYPGERSGREAARRSREGIPIGQAIRGELEIEARRCGVAYLTPMPV